MAHHRIDALNERIMCGCHISSPATYKLWG
jgi:hypothetical protein